MPDFYCLKADAAAESPVFNAFHAFRQYHFPEIVILAESILSYIGEDAFSKNHYLREVVLPESVKSIENGAFRSCIRLQAVEIRHDPEVLGERIVNGNTAIRCYPGSKVEEYCKAAGIRVRCV